MNRNVAEGLLAEVTDFRFWTVNPPEAAMIELCTYRTLVTSVSWRQARSPSLGRAQADNHSLIPRFPAHFQQQLNRTVLAE